MERKTKFTAALAGFLGAILGTLLFWPPRCAWNRTYEQLGSVKAEQTANGEQFYTRAIYAAEHVRQGNRSFYNGTRSFSEACAEVAVAGKPGRVLITSGTEAALLQLPASAQPMPPV